MANKKMGLGKGLDSMFPTNYIENNTDDNVSRETLLKLSQIEPNQNQPRNEFEDDSINELADSIKLHGIIQPLLVKKKDNKMYEIIAGERRWRAARIAGLKEVPVRITEYDTKAAFIIAMVENLQRENLNPIDEAKGYQRLLEENDFTQDEVAEQMSKSRVAITNTLRILKVDERVQEMIVEKKITSGHARALLSIDDKELQYQLALKIFDEKLSVRDTEKLVKTYIKPKKEKKKVDNSAEYKQYEDMLRERIGSKVQIQVKGNNKGKIVIDFFSNDEFERIYDMLKRE